MLDHFEWLHECQRQGISVSDFHAMMPWHLTTFIDVRIYKDREKLDKQKKEKEAQERMRHAW